MRRRRPDENWKKRSRELKRESVPEIRLWKRAGSEKLTVKLLRYRPKSHRREPDLACPKRFG